MPFPQVKLTTNGWSGTTRIEVDGVEIPCTRAELVMDVTKEPAVLRVDIPLPEVGHEGEASVEVFPAVAEALVALGWTPPQN